MSSSVTSSIAVVKASSRRSMPELQKIWRQYSTGDRSLGECAAMRRVRDVTVKVTSTISSSVGS